MEFVLVAALVIYLAPWVFAEGVEHPHANVILAVNLALGWTGVGWLLAAAWVAKDWPRAPAPAPRLRLVASERGASSIPAPRQDTGPTWPLVLALVAVLVGGAWATRATLRTPGAPQWRHHVVSGDGAVLRLGPAERWPDLGRLPSRCPVRVIERSGAWRRIWRLEGCEANLAGRTGWVRHEALVARSSPPTFRADSPIR